MKRIQIICLVSVTFLFACKSENKSSFDLSNAQKEINEVNRAFENYVSQADSVGIATNIYTIDAKFMGPNKPPVEGRAAITSAMSEIIKAGITGAKLTTKEIWGDENAIAEEGSFELTIRDGTVVDQGKYLVLWKKEDGKWKLHRDMFSTNLPLTTAH